MAKKEKNTSTITEKDELAFLADFYKDKDPIKYGIVGEKYIEILAKEKELRNFLIGSKNAVETAIESGARLYLTKFNELTIDDYIEKLLLPVYSGNEVKILYSLKGKKIGDFAKGYEEYKNAQKKYKEAGENIKKDEAVKALDVMEKYKKDYLIYTILRNIDMLRLEIKYKWIIEEMLKENLRGLEKIVSPKAQYLVSPEAQYRLAA